MIAKNIIDEPIALHHVNHNDVIPVPLDLHELYNYGLNVEKHRENLKPIIEQLYNIKL